MYIVLSRKKIAEDDYSLTYNETGFWGFMGFKKGFVNKWWMGFKPFSEGRAAYHILGFRFTRTPSYVSKTHQEICGWYTADKQLVMKLRNL